MGKLDFVVALVAEAEVEQRKLGRVGICNFLQKMSRGGHNRSDFRMQVAGDLQDFFFF